MGDNVGKFFLDWELSRGLFRAGYEFIFPLNIIDSSGQYQEIATVCNLPAVINLIGYKKIYY